MYLTYGLSAGNWKEAYQLQVEYFSSLKQSKIFVRLYNKLRETRFFVLQTTDCGGWAMAIFPPNHRMYDSWWSTILLLIFCEKNTLRKNISQNWGTFWTALNFLCYGTSTEELKMKQSEYIKWTLISCVPLNVWLFIYIF